MVRSRRLLSLLALLLGFTLIAASCGSDDDSGSEGENGTDEETEVPEGGDLVLGAEQEPDCVDWISSCAGASWGYWTINVNTMPRAYDVVADGDGWAYTPSILLDGEPELETDPQQVVTYRISEDAVWSDGEPITSSDFKYTWEQITTGEDIYDPTGYVNIESVDDSDPAVAVVTFSEVYAGWKGLFGGGYGIYPSHILEGEDRNAAMANGYDFSGGPWILEAWNKGSEIVLVPNENYWGEQPKLDSVTFQIITDTSAEFSAFSSGSVEAIYPQPQLDVVDAINEGKASVVTDHIDHFTETGIALRSGDHLEADIVVSATGFELNVLGDIAFTIDGEPLAFHDTVTYFGTMFTGIPNMAWVFGYLRASWTLRADLIAEFVVRLLDHMDAIGAEVVVPELRPEDDGMRLLPWIDPDNFNPGYIRRGLHLLPRQGEHDPWRNSQDYWEEKDLLPVCDLDDGALRFR